MKRIYTAVFMVSASALIFEVSLTRLFSIHLRYHFAFMVISIAMLGTGSAGTMLYVLMQKKDPPKTGKTRGAYGLPDYSSTICSDKYLSYYALLSGISSISSYLLSNYISFDPAEFSWDKLQFLYLALYCLVLSIPFFFIGSMIAAVFIRFNDKASSIYGFDLLGAGLGSILVLIILNFTGPEHAIIISSILCLFAVLLIGQKPAKLVSGVCITINLLILIIHPDFMDVKISPYKRLSLDMQHPGAAHLDTYHSSYARIDTFTSPAVRFAPGLSLKYPDPLPKQIGLAIDGGRTEALTEAGVRKSLKFLEFLPSSIGHKIAGKEKALIIDPKGGLHLLMARYYGFKEIQGIESNPLLVSVIQKNYTEFSGDIYDHNTRTGYGRNFLVQASASADSSRLYDLIDIPVSGTSVSGLFGISEDYKYTVEAFTIYLKSLNENGFLSISFYLTPPPRTELRTLSTIISALERLNVKEPSRRIAAIRSWDSMTVLVKNTVFTEKELQEIKAFSTEMLFDLVYYPGITEEESNRYIKMPSNDYFTGFQNLLNNETRRSFTDNYLFDIQPVHDDNPFFHYFLKTINTLEVYDIMGRKWLYFLDEGYLLPIILIVIFGLSSLLIVLPVLLKRSTNNISSPQFIPILLYFSMLGIGFMFIEVTLIQKSILLLENPSYSVGVILTGILISSGLGSLSGFRYPVLCSGRSILILCLLITIYTYIQPAFFEILSSGSPAIKITSILFSLFPLGFFMGIPFPMGMKLIGQTNHPLIPWAWSVNACMSVIAPILTIMLAIVSGFTTVLWISVMSYIIAFFALNRISNAGG